MIDVDCKCSHLPVRNYKDSELIIREGGAAGALYFLKAGSVAIYSKGEHVTNLSDKGTVLGEVAILLERPAMADVRALGDVSCYVAEDAEAYLQSSPEVMLYIAKSLAKKIDFMSAYLSDLRKQYAGQENHLGMVSDVLDSLLNTKD
ncbi:MAG: Crp/Fnr family transcriptional regulator [Coraliomargarita sp.]